MTKTAFRAFTGAVSLKPAMGTGWSSSRSSFRAFTGAVSLKRFVRHHLGPAEEAFRAFTGAVSLKQLKVAVGCKRDAPLPRLHRRGLIEACWPLAWTRWRPTTFRAFTGAVSLKRIRRGCRGLHSRTFRAFTGAVSLKPLDPRLHGRTRATFRAFTGAVSLKRGTRRRARKSSMNLPRLHRRGLIEACASATTPTKRLPPFRAFTGAVSLKPLRFVSATIASLPSAPSPARSH